MILQKSHGSATYMDGVFGHNVYWVKQNLNESANTLYPDEDIVVKVYRTEDGGTVLCYHGLGPAYRESPGG